MGTFPQVITSDLFKWHLLAEIMAEVTEYGTE